MSLHTGKIDVDCETGLIITQATVCDNTGVNIM